MIPNAKAPMTATPRCSSEVIDWTHPAHDRRRPATFPGQWLVHATHLGLIAIPALFALDLALTPHMFRDLPNFRVFAQVGSERQWAVALAAMCALSLAGWRSPRWWLRCAALFALGTAHWLIAWCFVCVGTLSTGTTTYPVLALVAWCYALEARLAR